MKCWIKIFALVWVLLIIPSPCAFSDNYYEDAYDEIARMLESKQPLSICRAVFLSEWAFLDGNLDYEEDFCNPIANIVEYLKRFVAVNHLEKYRTCKQIALCYFFFYPCSGNNHNPFRYNYSKVSSTEDWHLQLVSQTIKTHRGQCRSLPWTFKLIAEAFGANASIAYAPRHCFIMYRDEDNLFPEEWVNVETTTQQYIPTFWMKEYSAIRDSAIIKGTYLTPLSDEKTVAKQLADLAFGYHNKYNVYDEFTLKCVLLSLRHYPMDPNAIIIKFKSWQSILDKHLKNNGYIRDRTTDYIDIQMLQCIKDLEDTYWTQETEELKSRWNLDEETVNERKKHVQYIR